MTIRPHSLLSTYLKKYPDGGNRRVLAYLASLESLLEQDPKLAQGIIQELGAQRRQLKLIASENYSSLGVQLTMASWLTDKYAEGYPKKRFYAGCEAVDQIETLAADRASALFGADYAFVQPHCGADANLLAFMAVIAERIQPLWLAVRGSSLERLNMAELETLRQACLGQKMLAMSLDAGGHLTHGYRMNLSARLFEPVHYGVDPKTGLIDYHQVRQLALKHRPLILLAGYSSYPRRINFAYMRAIADEVNAVLIADMAHFAGLVAGQAFKGTDSPIGYAQIITTTTHKTLRGPRGGMVLAEASFAPTINKACPMMMGGPLPHVIAAKALAFAEAQQPEFALYSQTILSNARALAEGLLECGHRLITGGTDNHLMVIDVAGLGMNGKQAEQLLRGVGMTVNRNTIPQDPKGAWLTSGIRLGTPALSTLGMDTEQMREIAQLIDLTLRSASKPTSEQEQLSLPETVSHRIKQRTSELKQAFPLYPELPDLTPWEEG